MYLCVNDIGPRAGFLAVLDIYGDILCYSRPVAPVEQVTHICGAYTGWRKNKQNHIFSGFEQ